MSCIEVHDKDGRHRDILIRGHTIVQDTIIEHDSELSCEQS